MDRKKINRLGVGIFSVIFLIGIISSMYMYLGLEYISNNARIINYAGIVRGGSQRIMKLEISGQQSDELINNINSILDGLLFGSEKLNLIPPQDKTYLEGVLNVKNFFQNELLPEIEKVRLGEENSLVEKSEYYFGLCNTMVSNAELGSVNAVRKYKLINNILLAFNLFIVSTMFILFFKRKGKEIEDLENIDKITKGYNINKFKKEANNLLKKNKAYVVGSFDIKNVRIINDNVGFQNSNKLLKIINYNCLEKFEEGEIIGKSMSDEFCMMIKKDSKENIIKRMEKIFDEISIEFNNHLGVNYPLVFHCGLYYVEEEGEVFIESLIDKARHAHIEAKMNDGVEILFYDKEIHYKILNEIKVQNVMYDAMFNNEFKVYFQPKHRTKTKKLCGAEALTRWVNDEGDIIYPGQFIHIFEKNNFIVKLDMYILKETCKLIRLWIENGIKPVPVSVNFSRKHLANENFVNEIELVVDNHYIPHELIEIEMTENVVIENIEAVGETAEKLRKKGFLLSMDDFGSGHSSLGVLQNLDFDVVKIDKSFIKNYINNPKSSIVLANIIHMTKDLKLTTVAEGIESEEQYELMCDLDCDIIQGYYFSKPVPVEEFIKFF